MSLIIKSTQGSSGRLCIRAPKWYGISANIFFLTCQHDRDCCSQGYTWPSFFLPQPQKKSGTHIRSCGWGSTSRILWPREMSALATVTPISVYIWEMNHSSDSEDFTDAIFLFCVQVFPRVFSTCHFIFWGMAKTDKVENVYTKRLTRWQIYGHESRNIWLNCCTRLLLNNIHYTGKCFLLIDTRSRKL